MTKPTPPLSSDVSLPTDEMIEAGARKAAMKMYETWGDAEGVVWSGLDQDQRRGAENAAKAIYLAMRSKEPVAVDGLVEHMANCASHKPHFVCSCGATIANLEAKIAALSQSSVSGNETLRNRIAEALAPCLERAHNEYQLADAAIAALAIPGGVERVARAMCVAAGNDPESTVGRGGDGPLWQAYGRMARAAIKALGEG